MSQQSLIADALNILIALGMPRAQQNERSALTLLALLALTADKHWQEAGAPLIGITPIMEFIRKHYDKEYAPNTRETIRRQTMHQFVAAGIVVYNPDKPTRPVNSPKAVYQIEPNALALVKTFGTEQWQDSLTRYLSLRTTLTQRYANERQRNYIPVKITEEQQIQLSPGEHSNLIKAVIEEFSPRFVPQGRLVYVGDTGDKWGYFDKELLKNLGVEVDSHGKMPDVVIYSAEKNWLFLIECVTSHGPIDAKRLAELIQLFAGVTIGVVYVTAFPARKIFSRYTGEIAWETEVWFADSPSHLIHFNGDRFLGPYQ